MPLRTYHMVTLNNCDQNFLAGALELLPLLLEPDELPEELEELVPLVVPEEPELLELLLPDPEKASLRNPPALFPLPR